MNLKQIIDEIQKDIPNPILKPDSNKTELPQEYHKMIVDGVVKSIQEKNNGQK